MSQNFILVHIYNEDKKMKGLKMDLQKRNLVLQNTYAAVLAEVVTIFTKFGILEEVTKAKEVNSSAAAKFQLNSFGIENEEDIFLKLTEIFNCANWNIETEENGFLTEATSCKLCGLTKKMGGNSPCDIYCLNPMKAMIKGLNPDAKFDVKSTLWDSNKCKVNIQFRSEI